MALFGRVGKAKDDSIGKDFTIAWFFGTSSSRHGKDDVAWGVEQALPALAGIRCSEPGVQQRDGQKRRNGSDDHGWR